MLRHTTLWLVVLVSLLAVSGASANDVRVGRAKVQTDGGWRVFALEDQGRNYSGDLSGTIASETKVFVLESGDKLLNALVIVRASFGGVGQGTMRYSPNCKGDERVLAVGNSGFNRTYAECWVVSGKEDSKTVLNRMEPRVLTALSNVQLPQALVPITSSYSSSSGSFMYVTLLLGPTLEGREGQFNAPLPAPVELRYALVGQEFAKAVRDCMNSLSGKFSFPPMAFSK